MSAYTEERQIDSNSAAARISDSMSSTNRALGVERNATQSVAQPAISAPEPPAKPSEKSDETPKKLIRRKKKDDEGMAQETDQSTKRRKRKGDKTKDVTREMTKDTTTVKPCTAHVATQYREMAGTPPANLPPATPLQPEQNRQFLPGDVPLPPPPFSIPKLPLPTPRPAPFSAAAHGQTLQQALSDQSQEKQAPQVAQVAASGMKMVQKWVQRALDTGVEALRMEYRGLARYTLPEMTVDAFRANHEFGRNRYQDVPCQDQHRVVLKWHCASTDYIHANFVGTPVSARRFILTQGPLDGTINEFWQMVLQEEAETIIMLCNCIETGKNKCSPYWPDKIGETRLFNGGEVYNLQTRVLSPEEVTVIVCILNVKFSRADGSMDSREIRHYQWQDWPDRGVPPCRLTSMQYLYIHRVMLCYFLEKHRNRYEAILTEENKAKYKKFVEDYNMATNT